MNQYKKVLCSQNIFSVNDICRQRRQGRKQVARDRAKVYRRNIKLQDQLKKKERELNKYKMRYSRLLKKNTFNRPTQPSPRTKTKQLLRVWNARSTESDVRKTLTFHYALLSDLREKYSHSKNQREKQAFSRIFSGRLIKKYRMQTELRKEIGYSQVRRKKGEAKLQSRGSRAAIERRLQVRDFYLRDDVSRETTGKKTPSLRGK